MTNCWPFAKLGDHIDLLAGYAFKSRDFTEEADDIKLLRGANIGQGCLKWDRERRWPRSRAAEHCKFELAANDIVLAMDRPWIEAGLKWSVVREPDLPMLLVQRVARLRATGPLSQHYLRYMIGSPQFEAYVRPIVTGVNVPHISPTQIRDFSFGLPPRGIQDSISGLLRPMDDLIENNRRRIEILEEMARLLYREWFVHFRFPDHEDVELVDSDLGLIPNGWGQTCLGEEIDLQRLNIRPFEYPDEEFDHYSIPAFDDRRFPSVESGAEIRSGKYLLLGESVMVSKLNPRFPRVWRVDRSALVRRAVASTEFLVLVEPARWTLAYVHGLVTSTDFATRLATTAGGTSTSHQRVKPTDVMNMVVVQPPEEVMQLFTRQVEPMLRLADNLIQQIEVLRDVRDLLLPRLVTGELDVSELVLKLEALGV
ncbi:hypothetical protein [Candidatus Poriferisodalis sp.]|uniref:hypothetical protein n=1 Tax=Candidatus Poriferisodalis sp. TaxID=3101277 RepID=UPI003AF71AF1